MYFVNNGLSLKKLLKCLISKDNFKAGAFLGIYAFVMKGLLCFMRLVRKKEDWKNPFFAGGKILKKK